MFYLSDNYWRDDLDSRDVFVSIRCITYNHEKYIADALEGFVKQKTNFRFEAIVHDDASTDGTAAIIREYAEKYPSIIKPIFETENQYSKKDGSLGRIMNSHTRGKYVAYCEGDDYWTDPLKLQKQVDFLESHPDYSMIATNCQYQKENKLNDGVWNVSSDTDADFKDVVLKGGNFLITPSLMLRFGEYKKMPSEVTSQYVGDYPLQIYFAHIGKVRILKDITCVYRVMSQGSWSERELNNATRESKLKSIKNELRLLDAMDKVTGFHYHTIFHEQKVFFKFYNIRGYNKPFECLGIFLCNPKIINRRLGSKNVFYTILRNDTPWMYFFFKRIKDKLLKK